MNKSGRPCRVVEVDKDQGRQNNNAAEVKKIFSLVRQIKEENIAGQKFGKKS